MLPLGNRSTNSWRLCRHRPECYLSVAADGVDIDGYEHLAFVSMLCGFWDGGAGTLGRQLEAFDVGMVSPALFTPSA